MSKEHREALLKVQQSKARLKADIASLLVAFENEHKDLGAKVHYMDIVREEERIGIESAVKTVDIDIRI